MLSTSHGIVSSFAAKVFAVFLLFAGAARASDSAADAGFQHFYNLEYDQAISEFRSAIVEAPENPDGYNHLAQAILYRRMYESGTLENSLVSGSDMLLSLIRQPKLTMSTADDEEYRKLIQFAINYSRTRLSINPKDDAALYSMGVAYSLRANYDFLVRKAWISAIRSGNEALRMHKRVLELNPSRTDARLVLGVHDYVVANLPASLRILGAVAGIRGDKERGLQRLESVATHGQQNRVEAQMLLSVFYRHETRTDQAIPLLDGLIESFPRNYLLHFAKVYAHIELKDGPKASESLRLLEANRAAGIAGYGRVLPARICAAQKLIPGNAADSVRRESKGSDPQLPRSCA